LSGSDKIMGVLVKKSNSVKNKNLEFSDELNLSKNHSDDYLKL